MSTRRSDKGLNKRMGMARGRGLPALRRGARPGILLAVSQCCNCGDIKPGRCGGSPLARVSLRARGRCAVQSIVSGYVVVKIFSPLYERALSWSRHPRAPWFLGGLSFAESSFFPIPPDVMLAPMSLANPRRAYHFALLTTLASVAGGLFGYLIGYFAFDAQSPGQILHQ